jgi:predicted dehydrogenase
MARDDKLRVALVGCGQIADAHLQEIRRTGMATLVGVCDRQIDLARQAAARFGVPVATESLEAVFERTRPHVLHVTTSPKSHLPIALEALARGVHVYIEKPFAVDLAEAQQILAAADKSGALVCVGHDQLFDPTWLAVREMVARGELGWIVHVDSLMGYNLGGPFGRQLCSDPDHWVHSLPGGLVQNNISHAVYRVTDLIDEPFRTIHAVSFDASGMGRFSSEMRAMLVGERSSAQLNFSSLIRPLFRAVRVLGSKGAIDVDLDSQTIRRHTSPSLPGAFVKIQMPARDLTEAAKNLARNVARFARNDIHYFAGMRHLFRRFYQAVTSQGAPPIAYDQVLRVTSVMDEIFRATNGSRENTAADRKGRSGNAVIWGQDGVLSTPGGRRR